MASSSSSGRRWRYYDASLNFRREDTRKIFIGHLYKALEQKSINTFIDEKHIVVPIFYQVDPSDVRKLAGSFAEAFAQYDHDSNADIKEVQSWRSALTKASNLTGWDSRDYRDDAKFIEEIVQDIFSKLLQFSSVFLSYRGDTRRSFVCHLSKALCQKPINTFIDIALNKGNDIDIFNVLKDIQKSRISIVVFSENYASSQWCLRELVEILECADRNNLKVLPVFYGVDPSDVRKVTGPFAEALAGYEHNSSVDVEEVTRWRSALRRAADYCGCDGRTFKDDAELIEEIVQHTWRVCRD